MNNNIANYAWRIAEKFKYSVNITQYSDEIIVSFFSKKSKKIITANNEQVMILKLQSFTGK